MPATVQFFTAPGQNSFAVATPIAVALPEFPLGTLCPSHFVLRQQYMQIGADYARPAPNSACPVTGYTTGFFINDENFLKHPAGLVEWTRVWANVPTSYLNFETYNATFPAVQLLRSEFTMPVISKVLDSYFLIGAGGIFATAAGIPTFQPFRWIYANGLSFRATGLWSGSYPTLPQYARLCGTFSILAFIYPGQINPFAGGTYPLLRECTVTQYLGNIYRRRLRFTDAY